MKKSMIASLLCAAGIALAMPTGASAAAFSGAAATSADGKAGVVELVGRRDRHHRDRRHGHGHKKKILDIHIGGGSRHGDRRRHRRNH